MSTRTYYSSFYPSETAAGSKGSAAFLSNTNTFIIYLYKRSATTLLDTDKPNGDVIYTFNTGSINLTAVTNGWTSTVPTGTDALYLVGATATGTDPTDTILPNEWTSPALLGSAGTNGLSNATVFLFQRNNTGIAPAAPSTSTTYTFATGILSGTYTGWSQTAPDSAGGKYLFITTATAISATATDTIPNTEWATVRILAQDGADGYTAYLTNESHTLPATFGGVVSAYTGATGSFIILKNGTDVSSNFTLSTVSNPQVLTVAYSTNTYTISGGFDSAEDSATLTIRATGSGIYAGVTIDKVFSLGKSKGGADGSAAKLMVIYSDKQAFTLNGAGAYVPSGQIITFSATKQNTSAVVNWTTSPAVTIKDLSGNPTTTGDSVRIYASDTGANTAIEVTATLTDGTTITDKITIVKVQDGAPGTDAQVLFLSTTGQSFTFDGFNVADPASQTLTFTANQSNITGTATFVCTLYNAANTSLGTVVLGGTGNTRTLTNTQFGTSASYATVIATNGSFSDTVTVVKLVDGSDVITGYLTNEAFTLNGDAAGAVTDFSPGNGNFKVFKGTTDITSLCTFTRINDFGLATTMVSGPSATGGTYTATAIGGTVHYADFTATTPTSITPNPVTITKRLNASVAKTGATGANAQVLFLSATGQSFTFDGFNVADPASQTLTFTANQSNITGTATFVCTLYNAANTSLGTVVLGGTGNTRTLTNTQFGTSASYAIITATNGAFTDTVTVVKLVDGSDAITGFLSNEAITLTANTAGVVSSYAGATGSFRIFRGATEITSSCTFPAISQAATNINFSIVASGATAGQYTVTFSSPSGGTGYLRATLPDGTTIIEKVLSISIASQGTAGTDAITGYLTRESVTLGGDASGVVTDFSPASGNFKVFKGTTDITSLCTFNRIGDVGIATTMVAGPSAGGGAYTVTASSGTSCTATFTAVTPAPNSVTITKTLSVSVAKTGTPGTASITGLLTAESVVLSTYADGSILSYTPASGTFKMYSGTTDVTTSSSFSVSGTPVNGTATIGASTGVYNLTSMSADVATVTLTGTYLGITITKVFTVTKSKAGYEIVGTLPTGNLFAGRVVFLTTDSKLYRYITGTGWSKAADGADITPNSITTNKIDSGQITTALLAANSVTAMKLTMNSRPFYIPYMWFYGDPASNTLYWNTAQVKYYDNTGAAQSGQINAGSKTWPGGQYFVYWVPTTGVSSWSYSGDLGVAGADGNIVIGWYNGSDQWYPQYGQTIISGNFIQTGAIKAGNIDAGAVTAAKIFAGAVTTDKLAAGNITVSLGVGSTGKITLDGANNRILITD